MSDNGSVYNCKNHPRMRWFDTKPNGSLTFIGEITEDDKNIKNIKHPAYEPMNPLNRLRYYMDGKNPYAPSIPLDEPFTYDRLKSYMKSVLKAEEMGYSFECECPARDLVRLPDETYNSVHERPYIPNL